jgi:hypothetical protein
MPNVRNIKKLGNKKGAEAPLKHLTINQPY